MCGQVQEGKSLNSLPIEVCTLDSYFPTLRIEYIDILKIDVEGFEINVLDGSTHLLKSNLVKIIYVECDFNKDDHQHTFFNDIFEYLRLKNFSFHGLFEVVRYSRNYGIGYCNALFLNHSAFTKID